MVVGWEMRILKVPIWCLKADEAMKATKRSKRSMTRMAEAAMRDAIAKVIEDHRRRRMPLSVWEDGKVVFIQPDKLPPVESPQTAVRAAIASKAQK